MPDETPQRGQGQPGAGEEPAQTPSPEAKPDEATNDFVDPRRVPEGGESLRETGGFHRAVYDMFREELEDLEGSDLQSPEELEEEEHVSKMSPEEREIFDLQRQARIGRRTGSASMFLEAEARLRQLTGGEAPSEAAAQMPETPSDSVLSYMEPTAAADLAPSEEAIERPARRRAFLMGAAAALFLIAVIGVGAFLLLSGEGDDDATAQSAGQANQTAETATVAPTPAVISEASLPNLVTPVDELIALAGGAFDQVRTNDVIDTAFSSSPATGPFIESQGGRGFYNVWQATVANPTGVYNLQTTDILAPTEANARSIVEHLESAYEGLLNEDTGLPAPEGWKGYCRTGLFPLTDQQGQTRNINVYTCSGQHVNVVANLSMLSVQPFGPEWADAVQQLYAARLDAIEAATSSNSTPGERSSVLDDTRLYASPRDDGTGRRQS
jgi:hypothetical protein